MKLENIKNSVNSDQFELEEKRSVGALFGVWIFIFPLIFSWFTLRKGYSTTARVASFSWLLVFVIINILADVGRRANEAQAVEQGQVSAFQEKYTKLIVENKYDHIFRAFVINPGHLDSLQLAKDCFGFYRKHKDKVVCRVFLSETLLSFSNVNKLDGGMMSNCYSAFYGNDNGGSPMGMDIPDVDLDSQKCPGFVNAEDQSNFVKPDPKNLAEAKKVLKLYRQVHADGLQMNNYLRSNNLAQCMKVMHKNQVFAEKVTDTASRLKGFSELRSISFIPFSICVSCVDHAWATCEMIGKEIEKAQDLKPDQGSGWFDK